MSTWGDDARDTAMKVRVWCSQCSYDVEKDVQLTYSGSGREQMRRALASEAESHEHDCWYMRASWTTGHSFYETRLCGDDPP